MADLVHSPASVFPTQEVIPVEFRPLPGEGGHRYLIDGAVRKWTGPCEEVRSPVYVQGPGGLKTVPLGRYPLMREEDALQALEAARRAYESVFSQLCQELRS